MHVAAFGNWMYLIFYPEVILHRSTFDSIGFLIMIYITLMGNLRWIFCYIMYNCNMLSIIIGNVGIKITWMIIGLKNELFKQ